MSKFTEIATSLEFDSTVYKIVFNRPKRLNAMSAKMYEELVDALNEAAENPSVVLCCFTGAGTYFSSGNDLNNYMVSGGDKDPDEMIASGTRLVEHLVNTIIRFPKPLIALVNGPAVGISFTILGLFDLVLASEKATFHSPFTQLALSPEGCSSYTFPALAGRLKANNILLFNQKISAKEALELGLITEILPADSFDKLCTERLEQLSKLPKNSLIQSRDLMRRDEVETLLQVNKLEMDSLRDRLRTGEFMDSVLSFVSKSKSKL